MARDLISAVAAALVAIIQDVATDPRKLKPGECCRLLNSTPLGPVIDDRRLRGHRERAGTRIGDGKTIDLLRYAGWLAAERHAPKPTAAAGVSPETSGLTGYDLKRERERERNAALSRSGRDIGEIPPPDDPTRRAKCRENPRLWCDTYLPHWFALGWSPDLAEVAESAKEVVLHGGQQPCCMPRGGGKSTLAKALILWAILEGHRGFAVLIAANKDLAQELLEDLKHELLTNERLAADYPEVCIPVAHIGNIAQRCKGQTYQGKPTWCDWGKTKIVLPTIEGSPSSGAILWAKGLTGSLRGLNIKGRRPDLALLDDVQTDASAKSARQIRTRMRLIKGAVRGLAGPGKEVAIFAMLTVIQPDDVADQLLNSALNPDWQGRRYKLLYKFPLNLDLWRQYDDIRKSAQRAGATGAERWTAANAFYRNHRKAMDAGSKVAWDARKLPVQLSALQFAMDLFFDDELLFLAEYQNTPKKEDEGDVEELDQHAIAVKVNGLDRGVVPLNSACVVGFVDVQHRLLYWAAGAICDDMTAAVIDYQAWPEQSRPYFTLKDASPTLDKKYPKSTSQAGVKQGLIELGGLLKAREWKIEGQDGTVMHMSYLLVDWRDGTMTAEIAEVCRMPEFHGWMIPTGGKGITPGDTPMHQYRTKPGEKLGLGWHYKFTKYRVKSVDVDTNYWKTTTADALQMPFGNRGALVLFGGRGTKHEMLAEHCVAETRQRLKNEKTGRTGDVWKIKPGKPDNHFWDCLVGVRVGGSLKGCSARTKMPPSASGDKPPPPPPPAARTDDNDNCRPLF